MTLDYDKLPWIFSTRQKRKCPICDFYGDFYEMAVHITDFHKMSID